MRSIVFCNVFSALQWCAAINHPAEFGPDFIVFLGTSVVSSYSYQGHRPRRTQTKDQCGPWCLGQVLGVFHGSPPKGPVGGLPLKTVKSADCVFLPSIQTLKMFNLAMFNLSVLMFNLDCRLSCQCTEATGSNLSKLRLCDFDHRTIMLLCAIMSLVPAMMMPMSMAWRGGSGNGSGGSGGWQRDGYGGWQGGGSSGGGHGSGSGGWGGHGGSSGGWGGHGGSSGDHLDLEDGVAMVDHLDPDNGKVMDLQVATADLEDGVAMVDHLDPDNGKVMATADHLDLEGGVHLEDHKDHGTPLRLRQDLQVAQEGKSGSGEL